MIEVGVVTTQERVAPLFDARARALFALLLALNLADVVTTRIGLDRGAVEQNPLMSGFVDSFAGALFAKTVLMGIATGVLYMAANRGRRVNGVLWFTSLWYVGVIAWNIRIIVLQT
jgi:hypothetical protein